MPWNLYPRHIIESPFLTLLVLHLSFCSNVKDVLGVLATWSVFGTEEAAPGVTSDQLDAVLRGEFPWQDDSILANGGLAPQCHYGRRQRTVLAQLARTQEEGVILPAEVLRTIHWIKERKSAMQARCVESSTADGSINSLHKGRVALLRRELDVLAVMQAKATDLRRHVKAAPLASSSDADTT